MKSARLNEFDWFNHYNSIISWSIRCFKKFHYPYAWPPIPSFKPNSRFCFTSKNNVVIELTQEWRHLPWANKAVGGSRQMTHLFNLKSWNHKDCFKWKNRSPDDPRWAGNDVSYWIRDFKIMLTSFILVEPWSTKNESLIVITHGILVNSRPYSEKVKNNGISEKSPIDSTSKISYMLIFFRNSKILHFLGSLKFTIRWNQQLPII